MEPGSQAGTGTQNLVCNVLNFYITREGQWRMEESLHLLGVELGPSKQKHPIFGLQFLA